MSARVDAVASRVQGALTTRKVSLKYMYYNTYDISIKYTSRIIYDFFYCDLLKFTIV